MAQGLHPERLDIIFSLKVSGVYQVTKRDSQTDGKMKTSNDETNTGIWNYIVGWEG